MKIDQKVESASVLKPFIEKKIYTYSYKES